MVILMLMVMLMVMVCLTGVVRRHFKCYPLNFQLDDNDDHIKCCCQTDDKNGRIDLEVSWVDALVGMIIKRENSFEDDHSVVDSYISCGSIEF